MLPISLLVVVFGVTLVVACRPRKRPIVRIGGQVLGAAAVVLGLVVVGVVVWARTATDTSQLARSIVWGESAYGDQDRFPARTIDAGADVRALPTASDSPFADHLTVDGQTLDEAMERNDTTALVILRGDEIVHEGYYNGSGPDATQTSFSVAKSFTAALVGIAVERGVIDSLDDPVTRYVDGLADRDRRFERITIRHLLTMTSGLSFADGSGPWDDPANTYHGTNLRAAAVSTPSITGPPGEVFHYNDWNVILLGIVLENATGTPVTEFVSAHLWQPMGAEADGSWSLDSDGHGFEKMFVGVNARARDFARFGLVFRDAGRVGDDQVVSAAFIDEATRVDTTTDPALGYQYLWWVDDSRDAFFANGDHGQFIYVDPAADVVIVRHGSGPGAIDWLPFFRDLTDVVADSAGEG